MSTCRKTERFLKFWGWGHISMQHVGCRRVVSSEFHCVEMPAKVDRGKGEVKEEVKTVKKVGKNKRLELFTSQLLLALLPFYFSKKVKKDLTKQS